MAATRGVLQAQQKDGRPQSKALTRLGHGSMHAEANTFRTFVTAHVYADGSGYVEVKRDDEVLHFHRFYAESTRVDSDPSIRADMEDASMEELEAAADLLDERVGNLR